MKGIINKIGKLYYIVYVVFLISSFLDIVCITSNPIISMILKCIRYICYLYFGLIFLINIKKLSLLEGLLLLISLIVAYFSHNKFLLITAVIILTIKNYDLKRIFKISFISLLSFFAVVTIFSQFNIIPDWIFERDDVIRHSLGFIYPTDCFSIYLLIVLLYFAAYKDKYNILYIILLEVLNVLLFIYTNGRLSFYLINITLILMLLLKSNRIKSIIQSIINFKVCKVVIWLFPFILLSLFMFVVFSYNQEKEFAYKVDDILSGRVRLTSEAFEEYKVTLFGDKIDWYGWGGYGYNNTLSNNVKYEYNFVDSSYPRILLDYGVILSMVILCGYSFLLIYFIKQKDLIMFFVFMIILVWSLIEPSIASLPRNIFIFTFSILLDRYRIFKKDGILKNEEAKC